MAVSHEMAREIMGQNFLGIREIVKHFGVISPDLSPAGLLALEHIPFDEETLRACADTHILVADVGLSLLGVRSKARKGLFYSQDWYNNEEFAKHTETACWRLIRKTPIEGSFSKDWSEQQALIDGQTDEIPSARQVVFACILHFLATGERLFEKVYVRTSDVGSYGYLVSVGSFDGGGLYVNGWIDNARYGYIGVASSRKPTL